MRWRDSTLGKLTTEDDGLIQTGPFGSQLHQADYQPEGIPVIMPKDITDGRVSVESVARVSEETANRLERHKLKPRSIVLPRRGEVTKRAFIRAEQEGWLCGTGCLKIELSGKELVPEFLYYFMEQGHVVQWLEQHAVGTTMLNLSAGIVADLPIHYPAVEVQCEIAEVLSTYDTLIENNLRRMALLEESVRLLYREWFVRLRYPGHEHTRIVNGVPEGWEKGQVADLGEIITGKTPSTIDESNYGDYVQFVKTPDMHRQLIIVEAEQGLSEKGVALQSTKIIPEGSILVACIGAKLGVVSLTSEKCQTNQQINAVIPHHESMRYYSFFVLRDLKPMLQAMGGGATMPNVNKNKFSGLPLLLPPRALMAAFNEAVHLTFSQIRTLVLMNKNLKLARDLLLPRLMNGEIAV